MDGIQEAPAVDFQSFPARIIEMSKNQYFVHIPATIRRYMKLHKGSLLQVAIRYITEKECIELYNATSLRRVAPQVQCPICGKQGSLYFFHQQYPAVEHYKKHGFNTPEIHYISKEKYPKEHKRFKEMKKK